MAKETAALAQPPEEQSHSRTDSPLQLCEICVWFVGPLSLILLTLFNGSRIVSANKGAVLR